MNNADNVIIRMYHTGSVGDCFLLLFRKDDEVVFTMLIDCGGYKTKKDAIEACVKDIQSSIVDNTLDLVVITHEHEDHVSGFNQARAVFDNIKFRQVWMSWAENEEDPLARKLLAEKGKKVKALQALLERNLRQVKSRQRIRNSYVRYTRGLEKRRAGLEKAIDLLSFENIASLASPGVRLKISDAMKYVKGKSISKAKSKMYRKPGEVIDDMVGGVKFHILGPPYDDDLHGIKNDLQHNEMYSVALKMGMRFNDFNLSENTLETDHFLKSPFSARYKMDEKEEKKFNREYYNKKQNQWRQIEYDWLDGAGELAIALTSYVNNTSLAFAIEMQNSKKVLLFPADAQSGNWMSWHDEAVSKKLKKNGGRTAQQLLAKTIFYKVGHHGSHNGTASLSGLEKMTEEKILAFMPLVQDKVPQAWGGSENFPAKALYKKLIEKTNGALIRTDNGLVNDLKAADLRKARYSADELKKLKKISDNPLYHEVKYEL